MRNILPPRNTRSTGCLHRSHNFGHAVVVIHPSAGSGEPTLQVLAGVGTRDRQRYHVVPLCYLAVHAEERGAAPAGNGVCAWLRFGGGWEEDEQKSWECG